MKIGFALEPIRGLPMDLILNLLKKALLEHFEFNWRIIPKVNLVLKSLGKSTTTLHLPIYARDNFDFSSNNHHFNEEIQTIINFINEHKKDLNIKYTLAHAPEDPNYSLAIMYNRLSQINTPIVLENVVGQSDEFFTDFYFKMKEKLGKQLAGYALDISHRYVNNWENWLNIPQALIPEIAYIHISDCTKEEDLHLPLGLGEMPFQQFFAFLKKIDFDGIITQELKPNGDQAGEIMNSSQHCIRPFSRLKYLQMKIRHFFIRMLLKKKEKEFQDVIELTAEEIGYDYM
ncbi:MAG: hypothetical protein GF308_10690 [Candidatus Heimdallarchaeota archaeon]|nr:hypothetical protein [Candidatus Heimdallarchaeota archaeon]